MAVRLSAGIHALVAARLGDADIALRHLRQAAAADLEFDPNSAGGIRIAGLGEYGRRSYSASQVSTLPAKRSA